MIQNLLRNFILYTRAAAIDQYKKGIESVAVSLLKYPCCLMKCFIAENVNLKLPEDRSLIKFTGLGSISNKEKHKKTRSSGDIKVISCRIGKTCCRSKFGPLLKICNGDRQNSITWI